jgi:hypothetical protein
MTPHGTPPLHPTNEGIAKRLLEGRPLAELVPKRARWDASTVSPIETWLKTSDLTPLVTLVRRRPGALGHPIIRRQVDFWRDLQGRGSNLSEAAQRMLAQEGVPDLWMNRKTGQHILRQAHRKIPIDFVVYVPHPRRPVADLDAKVVYPARVLAARAALQELVRAFVEGLVPEWTVGPVPSPRPAKGRPLRSDVHPEDRILIASLYLWLQQVIRKAFLVKKRAESEEAFVERVARAIVSGLHAGGRSILVVYGRLLEVSKGHPGPSVDEARVIARRVIRRGRVANRRFALELLAHWSRGRLSRNRIEDIVEDVQARHRKMSIRSG